MNNRPAGSPYEAPSSQVQEEAPDRAEFETVIVVGSNGHVWVAKSAIFDGVWLHMNTARIIRVWGTSQGLNQLVNGPLKETVLDASADVVSLFHLAIIAVIPSNESQWAEHLS